MENIKRM